jgi:HAD superfamily hydrolase (TIGR01509 family)
MRGRFDIYLFTAEYIQEDPVLRNEFGIFKGIFSAARLNIRKSESRAYITIADMIGVSSECILYIDDKQENCDMAKRAGMAVVRYKSNEQIVRDVTTILTDYPTIR